MGVGTSPSGSRRNSNVRWRWLHGSKRASFGRPPPSSRASLVVWLHLRRLFATEISGNGRDCAATGRHQDQVRIATERKQRCTVRQRVHCSTPSFERSWTRQHRLVIKHEKHGRLPPQCGCPGQHSYNIALPAPSLVTMCTSQHYYSQRYSASTAVTILHTVVSAVTKARQRTGRACCAPPCVARQRHRSPAPSGPDRLRPRSIKHESRVRVNTCSSS